MEMASFDVVYKQMKKTIILTFMFLIVLSITVSAGIVHNTNFAVYNTNAPGNNVAAGWIIKMGTSDRDLRHVIEDVNSDALYIGIYSFPENVSLGNASLVSHNASFTGITFEANEEYIVVCGDGFPSGGSYNKRYKTNDNNFPYANTDFTGTYDIYYDIGGSKWLLRANPGYPSCVFAITMGDVAPPVISNINCTSNPDGDTTEPYNSSGDLTPTWAVDTDLNADGGISNINGSFTACTTTGATSHICTLPFDKAISCGDNQKVYVNFTSEAGLSTYDEWDVWACDAAPAGGDTQELIQYIQVDSYTDTNITYNRTFVAINFYTE